jgi:hypothetical protein
MVQVASTRSKRAGFEKFFLFRLLQWSRDQQVTLSCRPVGAALSIEAWNIREGDAVDESAVKELIRSAVAHNGSLWTRDFASF